MGFSGHYLRRSLLGREGLALAPHPRLLVGLLFGWRLWGAYPQVWWQGRGGSRPRGAVGSEAWMPAGPALCSVDGLPSASERGPRGDCSGESCRAERKPLCPGRLPRVRPWWPGVPGRRRPWRVHSVLCLPRGEEPGCSGPNGYSRVLLIEQQSGRG